MKIKKANLNWGKTEIQLKPKPLSGRNRGLSSGTKQTCVQEDAETQHRRERALCRAGRGPMAPSPARGACERNPAPQDCRQAREWLQQLQQKLPGPEQGRTCASECLFDSLREDGRTFALMGKPATSSCQREAVKANGTPKPSAQI